jgi:hypothetical protein
MKVIRSNWLPFLVVPAMALVVAGALWAELRQTDRSVHRVIKPVPALSNISPNSSPSRDSTLTLTVSGDGFVDGASLVQWDGEDLPTTFESTSELTARISPQRLSTPGDVAIAVFNPEPGGGTSTSMTFTITESEPSLDLFVPVVVSLAGADGPTYTSEMTLTNKTDAAVTLSFRYTATPHNVTGQVSDVQLPPGQQIESDAIDYLRGLGLPIASSGNRVGTVRVRALGTSSPADVAITVRISSAVPEGRAGLSYMAVPVATEALTGPSYLCGLRQNETDRTNLAVQHAGTSGNITLRVSLYSGDDKLSDPQLVSEVALPPGGFKQFNSVLHSDGLALDQGYAKIERISGEAPYYAYAVINDQVNSDGSFVAPVREDWMAGRSGLTLPVVVETGESHSEVIVANWSSDDKTLIFDFVDSDIDGGKLSFSMDIEAGSQQILGDFIDQIRQSGFEAQLPSDGSYAGPLMLAVDGDGDTEGDGDGIFLGARTMTPGGGGQYSFFYLGVPAGTEFSTGAWLYGLQQDSEDRTNLGLLTTSSADSEANTYEIDLYDGATGLMMQTITREVSANQWAQIEMILKQAEISQGYAHVKRTAGANDFITYAVINDGGKPDERSDDGAFVPGVADIAQ